MINYKETITHTHNIYKYKLNINVHVSTLLWPADINSSVE
jgi:hypothetical protein